MRLLLTAIFLLTANGAVAKGEGRYVVTSVDEHRSWVLTDTKTGKFRVCRIDNLDSRLTCHSWFDGVDGKEQPLEIWNDPQEPWKYINK